MKSVLFFLLIALSAYVYNPLRAQSAADIFDPFYEDLTLWEKIGLIDDAPPERPYPLQEIKRLLTVAMQNGDSIQQKAAQTHYKRLFNKSFHPEARLNLPHKIHINTRIQQIRRIRKSILPLFAILIIF